jgi:tetratricopeptide (TPR) repeat protein
MKLTSGREAYRACIAGCLCLLAASVLAQSNKTVIGPSNLNLHDGAVALKARDIEEGIRLTIIGLQQARNARERQSAKSNLCAGYLMLGQLDTALAYCNEVLGENDRHWRSYSNRALIYMKLERFAEAEQDLEKGEAINPNAKTLKAVRRMLLDETNPVAPTIVIDDRRRPAEDPDED